MLPRAGRLNQSNDFQRVTRSGVRAGRTSLVVHAAPTSTSTGSTVRVGFVVSKAVGNAVTRNRVKRQLRHLSARRLGATPVGTDLVVRALPGSAEKSLGRDLESAWTAALTKLDRRRQLS